MINAVDMMYGQLISMNGLDALVDGKTARVLISETSKDEIVTDQSLHEGSLIKINEDNYLIISMSEQFNQGIYKIGQFEKTLPILLGSNYKPINAVVKKYRGEFVDGTYIDEVHDQYTFKISKTNNNNMNTQSTGNDQIVYDGGLYNILSVDNTNDGILILTGKYDTIYVPHTYTITLNSNTQTLVQNGTFQMIVTATDNGTTVSNPTLTFISSDESIATVNNGLITAIGVGSCTISVNFNGVIATLTLTVNVKPAEPVISYSYTWSNGSTGLKYMSSTTFTATKLIDGVIDPSLVISYEWDSVGASLVSGSKVTMTKKTDASWTIKNTNVQTITNCTITWKDVSTGTVIYTAPFQFRYMS